MCLSSSEIAKFFDQDLWKESMDTFCLTIIILSFFFYVFIFIFYQIERGPFSYVSSPVTSQDSLTHYSPVLLFCTPWKNRKT